MWSQLRFSCIMNNVIIPSDFPVSRSTLKVYIRRWIIRFYFVLVKNFYFLSSTFGKIVKMSWTTCADSRALWHRYNSSISQGHSLWFHSALSDQFRRYEQSQGQDDNGLNDLQCFTGSTNYSLHHRLAILSLLLPCWWRGPTVTYGWSRMAPWSKGQNLALCLDCYLTFKIHIFKFMTIGLYCGFYVFTM